MIDFFNSLLDRRRRRGGGASEAELTAPVAALKPTWSRIQKVTSTAEAVPTLAVLETRE